MKSTNVFTATTNGGTVHLEDNEMINEEGWNMVNSVKDKNIIKCDVDTHHSMFLEE